MPNPYIPSTDAALLAFSLNFSTLLTAAPATYGLTAPDAATIAGEHGQYETALALAVDPPTRTAVTVAAKDVARASLVAIIRQYAMIIRNDPNVTDPNKIALGLNPINDARTPINAPGTSPLLNVVFATPGGHTLRFADTLTPDSGKKPFGAMQLQLFVNVGVAAIVDPTAAQLYGQFTKNPVVVAFDAGDAGKVATYFGRWVGRRGDVGPWSLPVSMNIAF